MAASAALAGAQTQIEAERQINATQQDSLLTIASRALEGRIMDPVFTLDEVTVSAVKQGIEEVEKQPTATLIDRKAIERNGVTGIKTASAMVPNLFIPDYGSRMTSSIYIRGIGARIDQPAVGLTIDNIPIMCKENYDLDLMDISRIEVLRGPQSAMYGRNTMGGVINVYTLSPLSYKGTRAIAEGASHGTWRAGVSHYTRVRPNLGLSGSLTMQGTAGEFTNEFNGRKCDWERQGTGRLKLAWLPKEDVTINNTLSASVSRQGGYPYERVSTGTIAYNDTCFYRRTSISDGLTAEFTLGKTLINAFASYQYLDDNMTLDQDFTPLPYFTLTQARKEHAATLDVIAQPNRDYDLAGGRYSLLNGLSAFYRHMTMNAPVDFYDTGIYELIEKNINQAVPSYPVAWDERHFCLGSHFTSPTWGAALYHSSEYTRGRLTLKASLRLDYEHAALNYNSVTHTGYNIMHNGEVFAHHPIDIDDHGKMSKHYFTVLPSLTASWDLKQHFSFAHTLHATISRGSKAGGYNTQMFSDVLQQSLMGKMGIGAAYDVNQVVGYKPESAWNFELGIHTRDMRQRARWTLDLNAFYTLCRDLQLTVFPEGNTTGRMMTNAGRSRNMGVEAALTWTPREQSGLTVTYGYTNAKFVKYNDGKSDYKGNYIPYVPTHTLHARAFNTWEVHSCGEWLTGVTLSANVQCAGRIYWNEANSLSQPLYALLGSELTLEGRHYSLELWGRNLTGTQYKTFYFVSMSREFLQRGHGRTLGATLRLRL